MRSQGGLGAVLGIGVLLARSGRGSEDEGCVLVPPPLAAMPTFGTIVSEPHDRDDRASSQLGVVDRLLARAETAKPEAGAVH
jgi:hypothetical protein